MNTPTSHPAPPPPARFHLESTAEEWLQALAAAVAADDRSEPRPESHWPRLHTYVDADGIHLDDWYTPAAWTQTGLRAATRLLDAAWDESILTGPYRPKLVSEAAYEHRVVLDPGPGFPQFATPAAATAKIGGAGAHGVHAAALFLQEVVRRANDLLDQLHTYLRMTSPEPLAFEAARFLAERDNILDQLCQDAETDDDHRRANERTADLDSQAVTHLEHLTQAVVQASTQLPGTPEAAPATQATERGSTSLRLDRHTRAFYAGVAAGADAVQQLNAMTTQVPDANERSREAYFWVLVGMQLQATRPGAGQDEQALFLRGAGLRVPEPPDPVFVLNITEAPQAADDISDETMDARYQRLAHLIHRVGMNVRDGANDGDIIADTGIAIGFFRVRTPL